MKRHNIKDREITPSKMPDVRSLDQRLIKRIKPGQQLDAKQVLLFDNSQRNCNGHISEEGFKGIAGIIEDSGIYEVTDQNKLPDLDTDLASLLPDYVKKREKYGF